MGLLLALNFAAVLGLCIVAFGKRSISGVGKIEATSISLRDPHGRVIGEIGSQQGLGTDENLYRPFIKFWDRGKDPVMTLYGTGLNLMQPDYGTAEFNFLGIDISSKAKDGGQDHFLLNNDMWSYMSHGGEFQVLPTNDGMNLTVSTFGTKGDSTSQFGVLTDLQESRMFVAAHNNEVDVNATPFGTQIIRGKSR